LANANFTTDGVDVAVRHLPIDGARDPELTVEQLFEVYLIPVCSPKLIAAHGPLTTPEALKHVPLIHDDALTSRVAVPTWADWFKAAGVTGIDVRRGLRFNSADHALDATVEGAGILLAHDVLAYDEVRTGRLVTPFGLTLRTGRAFHFVCRKKDRGRPNVQAFRSWIMQEVAVLDWSALRGAQAKAIGQL
jgi:LysR family glycine cleavage system transcriptional activator